MLNRCKFLLTVVYGCPSASVRKDLWSQLDHIHSASDSAWILGGDFNATLFPNDRNISADSNFGIDKNFVNWFHRRNLIEVKSTRNRYTWSNGRQSACLDRVIGSVEWINLFPEANVEVFPRFTSDHSPIVLSLLPDRFCGPGQKPFQIPYGMVLPPKF